MEIRSSAYLLILLVSFSLLLRVLDDFYYKDTDKILQIIGLKKIPNQKKISYYKKYDHIFCIFPFLWSWIDIFSASIVFANIKNYFVFFIIIIFIGGRFRALQESSHIAVHFGLCRSKNWQWFLSNIFFQYPCFKPDMYYRQRTHVLKHHRHPNLLGKDPNIDRFISVKFVPGISKKTFYLKLFHPLTPSGIKETLVLIYTSLLLNRRKKNGFLRFIIITFLVSMFCKFYGYQGLFILYVLPLLMTYPLFSWISLLAEHRWFVKCSETNRYLKECINARPTDYKGILGWIIKHLIFPGTDHYHLIHSLYPFIRWNYMKVIDIELKKKCPHYIKFSSEGLLFIHNKKPSALSELKDRMIKNPKNDLAPWANQLLKNKNIKETLPCNKRLKNIPTSIFEEIEEAINISNNGSGFIKLHQGKTIFKPCVNLKNWDISKFPLFAHEHASPNGIKELKEKIVKKCIQSEFYNICEENILITCGATHGLEVVFKTILNPGNEVIILSPQWLFIVGLIRSLNSNPIEAPIFIELSQNKNFDILETLNRKYTKKAKAIYFNTPNNPTGYSLNGKNIKDIIRFAKEKNLWIIADHAYEKYDFSKHGFIDISKYQDAKDRTLSIYTFSKTFAIPGYRIGYIVMPSSITDEIKKRGLYSIYSVSTTSQYAAFQVLDSDLEIINTHKREVKLAADIVKNNLLVPHTKIQGGFYTFLDISEWNKKNTRDFIKECIRNGVSLAPGIVFGAHCKEYARLCFTSVNNERLIAGIERINKVYFM